MQVSDEEFAEMMKNKPWLKVARSSKNKTMDYGSTDGGSSPPLASKYKLQDTISEADFATAFDDLATLCGWTWCGYRPARQKINGVEQYRTPLIGQKGCPDRILARNGVVLLIELKTNKGKLSPGQQDWAAALSGFAGYFVVRPKDWEWIEKRLAHDITVV